MSWSSPLAFPLFLALTTDVMAGDAEGPVTVARHCQAGQLVALVLGL